MFRFHLIQKLFGLGEGFILNKLFKWKLIKKLKIIPFFSRWSVALESRQLTGQKMQPCLSQGFDVSRAIFNDLNCCAMPEICKSLIYVFKLYSSVFAFYF